MYVRDLIFFNSMLVSIILVLILCLICIMAKPKMQICSDYHVSKGYVMLHMNVVKESNYSTFGLHLHTRVNPNLMLNQTNSIGLKIGSNQGYTKVEAQNHRNHMST